MKRLVLLALTCVACGPVALGETPLPINLAVSAAFADTLKSLRLSVAKEGRALDCAALQTQCVKDVVASTRFVSVLSSGGKEAKSLTVDLKLSGTPATQGVSVAGVTPGKDYVLLIEALDATARVTGISCTYLVDVSAGSKAVLANTVAPIPSALTCAAP